MQCLVQHRGVKHCSQDETSEKQKNIVINTEENTGKIKFDDNSVILMSEI